MAAATYNIEVDQGSDYNIEIEVKEDGVVKNLTGYSARAQARSAEESSSVAFSFTCTIPTPLYLYDLEVFTGSDAAVSRLIKGTVTLDREITRQMATTLTISPGENTTLTINGTSTTYNISGASTTLTMNTAISGVNATDIVYAPTGRMSTTNVQAALDELAGDYFMQAAAPSGSQLNEGDLWYDTDDDELKVYRGTQWQTLAGAGGDVETMMSLDGGSF